MLDGVDPAQDQGLVTSEIFVGQEWHSSATRARDVAQMKGVMPRVIAMSEPLRVMHHSLE